MAERIKATTMAPASSIGLSMKNDEYFANTPRLMQVKIINDNGNWTLSNFFKKEGTRRRIKMTTNAGRNITMVKIFTMGKNETSMVSPTRSLTRAGSEKGTKRVEITTIINTSEVLASKRIEIKGATTPVEIPDRSRTGRAYSGQITLVRKKRPAGRITNFKKHNIKRIEVVFFMSFRIAINSIFKKLKNNRSIIK
jgi:hypothetical protein